MIDIIETERKKDELLNSYIEEKDWGNVASWFNTERLRPNPNQPQQVQKQFNVIDISKLLPPKDRGIIQNKLNGTYQSLLTNINNLDVDAIKLDIENLIYSEEISEDCINVLKNVMIMLDEKEIDPNYNPYIYITPVDEYGLEKVRTQRILDEYVYTS